MEVEKGKPPFIKRTPPTLLQFLLLFLRSRKKELTYLVVSSIDAVGAHFLTESTPFSQLCLVVYISLVAITSLLGAINLK